MRGWGPGVRGAGSRDVENAGSGGKTSGAQIFSSSNFVLFDLQLSSPCIIAIRELKQQRRRRRGQRQVKIELIFYKRNSRWP